MMSPINMVRRFVGPWLGIPEDGLVTKGELFEKMQELHLPDVPDGQVQA